VVDRLDGSLADQTVNMAQAEVWIKLFYSLSV